MSISGSCPMATRPPGIEESAVAGCRAGELEHAAATTLSIKRAQADDKGRALPLIPSLDYAAPPRRWSSPSPWRCLVVVWREWPKLVHRWRLLERAPWLRRSVVSWRLAANLSWRWPAEVAPTPQMPHDSSVLPPHPSKWLTIQMCRVWRRVCSSPSAIGGSSRLAKRWPRPACVRERLFIRAVHEAPTRWMHSGSPAFPAACCTRCRR